MQGFWQDFLGGMEKTERTFDFLTLCQTIHKLNFHVDKNNFFRLSTGC